MRANADIPRDAQVARKFGAEGIGLCRTEHMFFAEDRLPHVVAMILARTRKTAAKRSLSSSGTALRFAGLFKAMDGFPVVIRTLDPPLHEFLPKRENLLVDVALLPYADTKLKKEIAGRYNMEVKDLKKAFPNSSTAWKNCMNSTPCLAIAAAVSVSLIPRLLKCRPAPFSKPLFRLRRRALRFCPKS